MMNRDKLGSVGESSFDLNLGNHLRHAAHHLPPAQKLSAKIHQLGNAPAVANELEDLRRDQGDGFRVVQSHAAR